MENLSVDAILKVYEKKGANVSATCAALGISRRTFYNWKNANKELANGLEEVEESLIDFAESKLVENIQEGNMTAILFYLKTKGRNRGYVERQESDVNVNGFEKLMRELPDPDENEEDNEG